MICIELGDLSFSFLQVETLALFDYMSNQSQTCVGRTSTNRHAGECNRAERKNLIVLCIEHIELPDRISELVHVIRTMDGYGKEEADALAADA